MKTIIRPRPPESADVSIVLKYLRALEEYATVIERELLSRAQKDAEDTHRLQSAYGALYAEAARLRSECEAYQRVLDSERADLAALESQLGTAHAEIARLEAGKPRAYRRKKDPPF